ncbi:MAG: helix-turn-helix domain-containing protein, partial [Kofleriaceae bacterium]
MVGPPVSGVLGFGDLALDVATGELRRVAPSDPAAPAGTLLGVLGARPARLLAVLASHPGQLVTRDEIQAALWTDGTTVDFAQSINQYIRQLRQVLHDDAANPTWIQTLPARGYRFLVASRVVGAARNDAPAEISCVEPSGVEPIGVQAAARKPASIEPASVEPASVEPASV